MTLATAMYWTGMDPMTKTPLFVAKEWKDRKIQQALLQPHKPEHRAILHQYREEQKKRGAQPVQKKIPMHPALPRDAGWSPKNSSSTGVKPVYGQGKNPGLSRKGQHSDPRQGSEVGQSQASSAGPHPRGHSGQSQANSAGPRQSSNLGPRQASAAGPRQRSIVEPPRHKLGRKLHLDSR